MIDLKINIDVTSINNKAQARKILAEIFNRDPSLILYSKHALEQMKARDLKFGDILNVLNAGKIFDDPELVCGSLRYRLETNKIIVVISFKKPNSVTVITTWRK